MDASFRVKHKEQKAAVCFADKTRFDGSSKPCTEADTPTGSIFPFRSLAWIVSTNLSVLCPWCCTGQRVDDEHKISSQSTSVKEIERPSHPSRGPFPLAFPGAARLGTAPVLARPSSARPGPPYREAAALPCPAGEARPCLEDEGLSSSQMASGKTASQASATA